MHKSGLQFVQRVHTHLPAPADWGLHTQLSKEAHLSYSCSECDVNWWPYQTDHGRCPSCGGGTVRRQERASEDADTLYRIACDEAAKRVAHARFELYYAERELERHAA